jgi:probable phosphoglycerate mutase
MTSPTWSAATEGAAVIDAGVQLVLVRHALPVRVDAGRIPDAGPADPALTPRGHEQAELVATLLSNEVVSGIYSSPSLRARQTAAPLCRRVGIEAVIENALAEWDTSSPSYVPVEEMREAGGPRWEALRRGDTYDPTFDYEPYRETVVAGIDRILGACGAGTVVLFTHAGVVNAYLGHVLGQRKPFWLPLPRSPFYASISRLDVTEGTDARVVSINETSHLHDGLRREPV